jgi:hypothetical protein
LRRAVFCVEALEETIGKPGKREIFNSDVGSQFTSEERNDRLDRTRQGRGSL